MSLFKKGVKIVFFEGTQSERNWTIKRMISAKYSDILGRKTYIRVDGLAYNVTMEEFIEILSVPDVVRIDNVRYFKGRAQ